ncbi:hypothetical protein HJC23_001593 [Cyclotella cryptica]|uniref:Sulfotransferase domain-containing protein n=1 Tax=Cyclotella cryptica TaxID=29204 RepID=A0ABD3NY65_9STRA
MRPSPTNAILPLVRGMPPSPRSPSSRKSNAIGIMQAVTLCACSAAFAAMSTALLCILVLNGGPSNSFFGTRNQLTAIVGSQQLDSPRVYQNEVKCASIYDVSTLPTQRQYGRRAISLLKYKKASSTEEVSSENHDSAAPEGVVWLMSFPNSGTSYTIHAVRELTNTTTATNYGLEGEIKDEESVPAFKTIEDSENGPFLELIPGRVTKVPKLILTKTHCGGFCSSCTDLESFIETPRSFMRSCLKGKRGVFSNDNTEMTTVSVRYSEDLVKKVVHIFRNPMDNVVARFHLERKIRARRNKQWLRDYPNNKEGFQRWCAHMNENASQTLPSSHWIDSSLSEVMTGVPCLSEFYRYVQWHNLAFTATSDLQVPSYVFHYEDYSNRFEEVTDELLNFLDLDRVGDAPQFIDHKEYGDYYSDDEKHSIAVFIREFSTKPTWFSVKHYLTSFLSKLDDTNTPSRHFRIRGVVSIA